MKLCVNIVLLFFVIPIQAMLFDIESQEYYLVKRVEPKKDYVIIDMPVKECGICYEEKYLTGVIPCKEGDKHPVICDECMHELQEKEHISKGTCPFCRRALLKSHNLTCSICKEKFKNGPPMSHRIDCYSRFSALYTLLCKD